MLRLYDLIDKLGESIKKNNNFFQHKDIIIVGENNSGKSYVIKNILQELVEHDVYFIDSNNRNIPIERKDIDSTFDKLEIREILKIRLKSNNFNKEDVFSEKGNNFVVLNELIINQIKYKKLFKEVLDIDLIIEEEISEGSLIEQAESELRILINNEDLSVISDGYQAMLRILMEVDFAYEKGVKNIVIDEFDMHLDHINPKEFINKLKNKYNEIRFILCCHSVYTILEVNEFDVIKIIKQYSKDKLENTYLNFDSNDLNNIEEVDRRLFNTSKKLTDNYIELNQLIKEFYINNEYNEELIKSLKSRKLSFRENIVIKHIMSSREKK